MFRGLYTAASGMLAQQRWHDSITNNVSNMLTPGYKQDTSALRSFPEMLIHQMGKDAGPGGATSKAIGTIHTGVFVEENIPMFTQGDLTETKQPGDLALISNIQLPGIVFDQSGKAVVDGEIIYQPQAFFTVLGVDGEPRYTRNGNFHLNEAGQLLTTNGEPVLGRDGQPVVIAGSLEQVFISENGTLIDRYEGTILGQLLISRIDNPYQLIREGNGNYRLPAGAGQAVPITDEDQVAVRQGYLERSNVDAAQAMVDMMTALRLYEANQKVIQAYDQSLDKAVNEIGRVV